MARTAPRGPFGRSTTTAAVIEARVAHNYARNARVAFYLTGCIVGLLAATVAADYAHPILAALIGTGCGTVAGALVYAAVRSWPIGRWLWWWTPEILLGLAVVFGFTTLARHTTLPTRLAAVAVVVGVPAAMPAIRRRLVALGWCLIVRHRLRVCFNQFIIANRSGSLPLILWARPTPVGERVHVYLGPGLSITDLEHRLEKIAVACHATAVTVDRASDRTAAHVRLDIKRREALTATVGSPLVDLVDPTTPVPARTPGELPTALDLPDVRTSTGKVPPANGKPALPRIDGGKPSPRPATAPATTPATSSAPVVVSVEGEDVADWI
jgi:hypothetical protein